MLVAKANGLISGGEAGKSSRRVNFVGGAANGVRVAEQLAPAWMHELFFGLQLQRAAWHDPANAVGDSGNQFAGGDQRQQTFATARRGRANDALDVALFPAANSGTNFGELTLVFTIHDCDGGISCG